MPPLTLLLLRHAKSSWKDPTLEDHRRPLNSRGRKAARALGEWLYEEEIIPDVIYCSTSERTRETALRVFANIPNPIPVLFRDKLYHASPAQIQAVLNQVPPRYSSVMIIGHNPGLQEFLQGITREAVEVPTATLIKLSLEIDGWVDFNGQTRARIQRIWRPNDLLDH